MRLNSPLVASTIAVLRRFELLADHELSRLVELDRCERLAPLFDLAESIHVHIKVDDADMLPERAFLAAGAELDHRQEGYVKYCFPGQVNAIFSHIRVSEEDLLETDFNRHPRPFLDHVGIDLRHESPPVRAAFEELPTLAHDLGWLSLAQGGGDRSVYCCHTRVLEKRWLYPPGTVEYPGIPLEFAYGALVVNAGHSGCDLRPADPHRLAAGTAVSCCPMRSTQHDNAREVSS